MTKNLETLKKVYKTSAQLATISQMVEGRSVDAKCERRNYYSGEKEGIISAAAGILSRKEFQEFVLYTTQEKGEL
ncbi:MAG: hypothetical protein WC936_06700 [Candidatus Nanoarchaeia archaeon]|jgi:hypothetical protein